MYDANVMHERGARPEKLISLHHHYERLDCWISEKGDTALPQALNSS